MSNSAKVIDNQNNIPCIFIFRWVLWWTHWKIKLEMFIVWIGVSTPLKKITPSFSLSPLLNLQIVRPRFLGQNPYILFFVNPPPKNWIFQWTSIILNFLSLTESHLLKVTKFLVKISQFKFLFMTEKNIFVCKLFVIKYFRFSFIFYVKPPTPLKKVTPFFPAAPSKNRGPVKSTLFWKFSRRFNPPGERGYTICLIAISLTLSFVIL